MNPLSIFSFKTVRVSTRGIFKSLTVSLLTVIVISYTVSLNDAAGTFNGWNNPFYAAKFKFADAYFKKYDRIDVLHLSSSIGNQTRTEQWQEATGDKVICFNGAIGGQHPSMARLLFEKLYYPRYKIRHLVYSLCPRDINGKGSASPLHGPVWDSPQVRKLRDGLTWKEYIHTTLENLLYLYGARKQIHRIIQDGRAAEDLMYMLPTGTLPPSPKTSRATEPTSADKKNKRNPYRNFTISHGEVEELKRLADFCSKRDIQFIIINQPVSPFAYNLMEHPQEDYTEYLGALQTLRDANIPVLDMKAAIHIPQQDFSDTDHTNLWGGHTVTNFIFKNVIRKWFSTDWDSIPPPCGVSIAEFLPPNHNFLVREHKYSNFFRNQLQVEARPNLPNNITLELDIPPGKYHLNIHSYINEFPTPPSDKIGLVRPVQNMVVLNKNPRWQPTFPPGAAILDSTIKVIASPAVFEISCLKPITLDSLMLTPAMPAKTTSSYPNLPEKLLSSSLPQLIRNGEFNYGTINDTTSTVAAEWSLYTGENEPWGTADRIVDASGNWGIQLSHDTKVGWGSIIMQRYSQPTLKAYSGNTLQFQIEAKSSSDRSLFAENRIVLNDGVSTSSRFSISKIDKDNYEMTNQIAITDDINYMTLQLGCLTTTPIVITKVTANPVIPQKDRDSNK